MSRDPIEMLLDKNCCEPILLYGENGDPMSFDQIALIPINDRAYAILKPIDDGILKPDEALVFEIAEDENGYFLEVVMDEGIIDAVFGEYDALVAEQG